MANRNKASKYQQTNQIASKKLDSAIKSKVSSIWKPKLDLIPNMNQVHDGINKNSLARKLLSSKANMFDDSH